MRLLLVAVAVSRTMEVLHLLEWSLFDESNAKTAHLARPKKMMVEQAHSNHNGATDPAETPKSRSAKQREWLKIHRRKWSEGMMSPNY